MAGEPGLHDSFSLAALPLIGAAVFGLMAAATLAAVAGELGMDDGSILAGFGSLALLTVIGIAVAARSREAAGHLVAGSEMGPVAQGLTTASCFGLAATVLLPGLVYQHGFDGLIVPLGIAGGLVLMLAMAGPALVRAGAATVPEFLGLRFGRLMRAAGLAVAAVSTMGLLAVTFGSGVSLVTRVFDVPAQAGAIGFAAAILLIVMPGGLRSAGWAGVVLYILAAVALIGGLAIASFGVLGNPAGVVAYGTALKEISPAEEALIEAGLVDFGLFKPFLKEFLTVDRLNWVLLAVSLMAAIAVLPPLVQSTRMVRGAGEVRRGIAWTLLFTLLLLTAVPAIAALARIEVYRAVSAGTAFTDLPPWVRAASASGAVRLHGTSVAMVADGAKGVAEGQGTLEGLGQRFAERGGAKARAWERLDVSVQQAVLEAAKAQAAAGMETDHDRWGRFASSVLPAAALAAGNESGKAVLAAVAVDPEALVLALPQAAGMPVAISALAVVGVLGAAFGLSAFLTAVLAGMLAHDGAGVMLGRPLSDQGHVRVSRLLTLLVAGLAAVLVLFPLLPADLMFVASLTLAASGLLPLLLLGIWWPRANAWGAFVGLLAGLGLGAYYLIGTTSYAVTFYDTWAPLSNAGPEAFAEFEELKAMWVSAEGDQRTAAFNDLAARATGALWSPGLANWFGVAPAAGAALAIPVSLLVAILVSLMTPRPDGYADQLLRAIHSWRRRSEEASVVMPPELGG